MDMHTYEKMLEELFVRYPSVQSSGFGDAYKPGLEHMLEFAGRLGHPERSFRSIHVAGTNGKGSVANMLAAALSALGLRVGLYTSPHIIDFRERMRIIDGSRAGASASNVEGDAGPECTNSEKRTEKEFYNGETGTGEVSNEERKAERNGECPIERDETGAKKKCCDDAECRAERNGEYPTERNGECPTERDETGAKKKCCDDAECRAELISRESVWEFITTRGKDFDELSLSFFEITTGMAFWWFGERKVDVAVIEVGLGGRLDSTNIITPELSVITSIGLDHCALLGNTRAEIAAEKAGIFKPGVPAVVGAWDEETAPVFESAAARVGAVLTFADSVGRNADLTGSGSWKSGHARGDGQALSSLEDAVAGGQSEASGTMASNVESAVRRMLPLMDLRGEYQEQNLRTTLTALEVLGVSIADAAASGSATSEAAAGAAAGAAAASGAASESESEATSSGAEAAAEASGSTASGSVSGSVSGNAASESEGAAEASGSTASGSGSGNAASESEGAAEASGSATSEAAAGAKARSAGAAAERAICGGAASGSATSRAAAVERAICGAARLMGFHGRWELIARAPDTICDIGHNPPALRQNFAQLRRYLSSGRYSDLVIVYGVMSDKDLGGILPLMLPDATYICVAPATPRALKADALYAECRSYWEANKRDASRIMKAPSVAEGIKQAREIAKKQNNTLIYIGGSTFVVSEAVANSNTL